MTNPNVIPTPSNVKDLTGNVYGNLTVLGYAFTRQQDSGQTSKHWWCRCACGREQSKSHSNLHSGNTKNCRTCGPKVAAKTRGCHGQKKTPEWRAWQCMKRRCDYAGDINFRNYGGRGIRVCERWLGKDGFANFLANMGERPSAGHSLDRIDVNGHYQPGNCRWATRMEQAANMRTNRWFTHDGRTMILADWIRFLGLSKGLVTMRLHAGWSMEDALFKPKMAAKRTPK